MIQPKRVSTRRAELSHTLEELAPAGLESSLLRQQIIGALRRAIELGTLRAGDRLVEKDLCAAFKVSRTSLREALRDLEAHGVVTKLSARTLIVTPVSREDAFSISRVRAAIEMMLAEQFIKRAKKEDLAAFRAALDRMLAIDPNSAASLDANREYYELWCKGAGNVFAFDILMNIQLRLGVVRSRSWRIPELRQKNLQYQEAIFDCMARRSVKEARDMVRRHNRYATLALVLAADSPAVQSDARPQRSAAG